MIARTILFVALLSSGTNSVYRLVLKSIASSVRTSLKIPLSHSPHLKVAKGEYPFSLKRVGQAIPAKLVDGELMFLAVYTVGQKHYSTNIFLDPTLFTQTTQNGVEITSLKDYSEPEQLMIAGIAIFLALIIKYD